MPQIPPVTKALMLICTALFCVQLLFGFWVEALFALWPLGGGLGGGSFMPWQLITYAFLHGSMGHLFFNMLGLWMFGSELESIWGRQRYLQFLGASALAGGVIQLIVVSLGASGGGPTLGASGALFGLLMAFGMMFPDRTIMPLFPPIPMKAKIFVMVFGGIELLFGLMGSNGVAHFAHLGGMLGGWLMMRYWRGLPPFPPRQRRR
ncbi:rhomboid family intramembrane serine protease [Sphaerotilus natans]|jgi:membrane associated rhomboid family serine protease|uniref:Membrane associated rhomboid family serine protease n=2 Tax=Sphaerotilus TaxID=34102 RepID=A0A5C1PXB2_9BURK|nr:MULTISPECIES: rhomboid family intramembrane serine protease [Sphaerotilus]KDB53352.1 rhomboid family protein [Sphaerotilus natans subsp. natans DSM 6575]NZD47787.1 rhomboid family intramembrane serine protease [Sphaerotilus sulfidivorans]QEM99840.1 rhomboid family intramembrane serine protease [Sphaerotilus sulfidivorans]SIP99608.1 Membrane associated serine protease, rhomboid family [Sphaerotilus natans]GIX52605.1 rhomboid family intramembrane serine protease [Sphaerotilus natans]